MECLRNVLLPLGGLAKKNVEDNSTSSTNNMAWRLLRCEGVGCPESATIYNSFTLLEVNLVDNRAVPPAI